MPNPFLQQPNENIYTGFEFTRYHILLNKFYYLLQVVINNKSFNQTILTNFKILQNELYGYYKHLDHINELILKGRKINIIENLKLYEERNIVPEQNQNLIQKESLLLVPKQTQQISNNPVFKTPRHPNQQQSNPQNLSNNYKHN